MQSPKFSIEELVQYGLPAEQAKTVLTRLNEAVRREPSTKAWTAVSEVLVEEKLPFAVHRSLFERVYADWDRNGSPRPVWNPSSTTVENANVTKLMRDVGASSVQELHSWSNRNRAEFWRTMIDALGIPFEEPPDSILDVGDGLDRPRWFRGGRLNIAASCFQGDDDRTAVVMGREDGSVSEHSLSELKALVARVAGSLQAAGLQAGDAVAMYLPMNYEAVAIYLGVIWAGGVVVGLAESLSPPEVKRRLEIVPCRFVFTQDVTVRGGKRIALYEKLLSIGAPQAIVVPFDVDDSNALKLRDGDRSWKEFLAEGNAPAELVICAPDEPIGVLFSSGTTADPKAIPWTHTTPIKCMVDAWLHQDVHRGDCVAWPTSLGWMMGPWLIFSSLGNRAAMALFEGAPTTREFTRFVQEAGVTMLGVVPTLISTWRLHDCLDGMDWNGVRVFSSTGECSQADDMFWLSSRAGYRPVIEYCGGTEIGGGYISSTVVEPFVPATFTTPAFGIDIRLIDADGEASDEGEVLIECPSVGFSTRLLNADHRRIYFDGIEYSEEGKLFRRHGDFMARLPDGHFRAHGRMDDAMNLGGIKVSSAEIERVLNLVDGIVETAAVAVAPPEGGPDQLAVFAVLENDGCAEANDWLPRLQQAVSRELNPLFRIRQVSIVEALPRTASNKVMRRKLRDVL